jgi:hypothetical protein
MFHVIVLGGIGLVGLGGCGQVATGDGTHVGGDAGGPDAFPVEGLPVTHPPDATFDAFPSETGAPEADAFPSETAQQVDAFPSEGLVAADSGGPPPDAFPSETAQQVDASPSDGPAPPADASLPPSDADCFPEETAFVFDSGPCPKVRR